MSARVVTTLCVILLSSCGTAAAMREPRVVMRIERRPDGFRAKPTPPTPPAPDAPAQLVRARPDTHRRSRAR